MGPGLGDSSDGQELETLGSGTDSAEIREEEMSAGSVWLW